MTKLQNFCYSRIIRYAKNLLRFLPESENSKNCPILYQLVLNDERIGVFKAKLFC